jgi:hypothetical protein
MAEERRFRRIKERLSTELGRLSFEADISGDIDAAMSLNEVELCIEGAKDMEELKKCLKEADEIAREYEIIKLSIKKLKVE